MIGIGPLAICCPNQSHAELASNPGHRFGGQMRKILLAIVLAVVARPLVGQGAPPHGAPNQPYTVEYYYKVQWGRQQEFLQLFLKNHYPLLRKTVESGRMTSV